MKSCWTAEESQSSLRRNVTKQSYRLDVILERAKLSKMTCLYLVRHGATDAIGNSFTGRMAGVSLNTWGIQQAGALAEYFRNLKIRSVFSSPTERARQTANIIASASGLEVEERCAFDEIEIGKW